MGCCVIMKRSAASRLAQLETLNPNAAELPRRKRRKATFSAQDNHEEERLSSLLFAGSTPLLANLPEHQAALGDDSTPVDSESAEPTTSVEGEASGEESAPVWADDDDDEIVVHLNANKSLKKLKQVPTEEMIHGAEYEKRLRLEFENVNQTPEWARVPDQAEENAENDLLRTTHSLVDSRPSHLPSNLLSVSRMNDANIHDRGARARQIQFHPTAPLLLTAGADRMLRLFQIDGKDNTKLQSIKFPDLPLSSALFTDDGKEVICTGDRNYFYSFDLMSGEVSRCKGIRGHSGRDYSRAIGNNDYISVLSGDTAILLSAKTKQWIGNLKMNGKINSASFSSDSSTLSTCGTDGEVYLWDLRTRRCLHRFKDEGAVQCTAIGQSRHVGGKQYLGVGSASGIVNIYDSEGLYGNEAPTPLKAISNLTTQTQHVKFNHDSQLMGISSAEIDRQFRLVHLPTCTTFANFPMQNDPLKKIIDFDFSPNSGFLALSNSNGRVLLYRLNYFDAA